MEKGKKKTGFDWWCDKAWIYFGCLLSAGMYFCVLLNWNIWDTGLKILAGVSVLIPVHVLEEWLFPGGFHYQYNTVLYHSKHPHCYPMNRLSDMYTNLVTTVMYIFLVIVCAGSGGKVPAGMVLGTAIFCMLELIGHTYMGIRMYARLKKYGKKTIYGPGSITAYWAFAPLGVISLYWLADQTMTLADGFLAAGILVFIAIVCIAIPEGILKKENSPYAFDSYGYYEKYIKNTECQRSLCE